MNAVAKIDQHNPIGTDGFEFVEFTAPTPEGIEQLRQLFTAVHHYSAPATRDALAARVGDALFDLAEAAPAGSDLQFQLVKAAALHAHTPAQLDHVQDLHSGATALPGLAVDTDLRWDLLTALVADRIGRRPTFTILCLATIAAALWLYQGHDAYGASFLLAAFATPLLFFAGSAFAYGAIAPLALRFFLSFPGGDNILPLWGFAEYLSFLFTLMVAAGIVFLLPVFLLFLIGAGLVRTRTLSRLRPWIIMAIAIAAAVLTPPDVVSQALLGIPLYLLFEGTLLVGKWMGK